MDKTNIIDTSDVSSVSSERNLLKIAKGGGIVYAGKLFLSFSRLITVVILARILGAEKYGMYNIALSAATLALGLAILGLDDALIRYIAVYKSRHDQEGLWRAFQTGIALSLFLSVFTAIGFFALSYPFAVRVFHKPTLAPLLQLTSVIIPALVLSDVFAGAAQGFKQVKYLVIAQHIVQPLSRLIMILILSLIGLNTTWAIITYGLADVIGSILFLYFLNKHFPTKRPIGIQRKDVQTLLSYSLPLWLSDLMFKFRGNFQTVLLGSLNTIESVGVYSVVANLNVGVQLLFSSIATNAKPMIAELHDRGDLQQMGRVYQTTTKWITMVNLPVSLTMILFPVPILSIFGKSFENGAEAMIILALAQLVNIATGMCGSMAAMTGHPKLRLLNTAIRVGCSIVINLLLIPVWGMVGAAVAALLVEIIVNSIAVWQIWSLFGLLPYDKYILNPLIAGLGAFGAALISNRLLLVGEKPFYAVFSFVIMLAVYIGISLALGLAPEDRLLLSRLQRRFSGLTGRLRTTQE